MPKPRPRITIMGDEGMEEIDYDELPPADSAADPADYFAPVTLSARALDRCSQIVPEKYYKGQGLHSWLLERANYVFKKMPVSAVSAKFRSLEYFFSYHEAGPVLENVREMP
jgi:hypothetical protein